jgi:hypothetical protein
VFGRRVQPDEEIRGLTVMEPWAMLLAIDEKTIETRSRSLGEYRGLVAIHASKRFPMVYRRLCWSEPFRSALIDAGIDHRDDALPLGQILAVATLHIVMRTEDILNVFASAAPGSLTFARRDRELAFGNYESNRVGLFVKDLVRLKRPVSAKGALGLWTFDDQPEALADVREQLREAV